MIKTVEIKINKNIYSIKNITPINQKYNYINIEYDYPLNKTKHLFNEITYDDATICFDWLNYKQKSNLKKMINNHSDIVLEYKKRTIFGKINGVKNNMNNFEITIQINYIMYGGNGNR